MTSIGDGRVEIRSGRRRLKSALDDDEIWLRRHVLDAQVIDVGGHRLVRVGDVCLDPQEDVIVLSGVEVDAGAVLRRLGMRGLGAAVTAEFLEWSELHVASGHGHSVQLQTATARIHKVTADELEVVSRGLTPARAAEVRAVVGARRKHGRAPHRGRFRHVLRARRRAPS